MIKVLFVCTGNTCRSPMAEAIFNKLAKEAGLAAFALSAGLCPNVGEPISDHSFRTLASNGMDMSAHKAKAATAELVDGARVYTMTAYHAEVMKRIFPQGNIQTISNQDITDPYGGNLSYYEKTYLQIYKSVEILIQNMLEETK